MNVPRTKLPAMRNFFKLNDVANLVLIVMALAFDLAVSPEVGSMRAKSFWNDAETLIVMRCLLNQ